MATKVTNGLVNGVTHGGAVNSTLANTKDYVKGIFIGLFPKDPDKIAEKEAKKAKKLKEQEARTAEVLRIIALARTKGSGNEPEAQA